MPAVTSSPAAAQPLLVAAGVVRRGERVLLTRRPETSHLGGYWEFPGGKVEPGEDPREALRRELEEECGLEVEVGRALEVVFHRYPERDVLLLLFSCRCPDERPVRHLGVTDHRWVEPRALATFRLPPANAPVAELLRTGWPTTDPGEEGSEPARTTEVAR